MEEEQQMKSCIIDVGGGMRGVYGAGVVEYLMDEDVHFDVGIGVSAGSSNIITYKAGQKGRLRRFYEVYPGRREYMGWHEKMRSGSFFNVKYIFEELSLPGREDPVDVMALDESPMDFYIVATDAETGSPVYFHPEGFVPEMHEASCNLPVLNKALHYDGRAYFDGGISDPIPWKKALELGCDRIVTVLTKPADFFRKPFKDWLPARILSRRFPEAGKALKMRAETYNRELEEILRLQEEGKLLIIAPDSTCNVTTTRHSYYDMERLYQKGYVDASRIRDFLEA